MNKIKDDLKKDLGLHVEMIEDWNKWKKETFGQPLKWFYVSYSRF